MPADPGKRQYGHGGGAAAAPGGRPRPAPWSIEAKLEAQNKSLLAQVKELQGKVGATERLGRAALQVTATSAAAEQVDEGDNSAEEKIGDIQLLLDS